MKIIKYKCLNTTEDELHTVRKKAIKLHYIYTNFSFKGWANVESYLKNGKEKLIEKDIYF
jgi:hypothetical protein